MPNYLDVFDHFVETGLKGLSLKFLQRSHSRCRSSEEETFSQKIYKNNKKTNKLQNSDTLYVTFCKLWIVDVNYLITEQLNRLHTQFVCA